MGSCSRDRWESYVRERCCRTAGLVLPVISFPLFDQKSFSSRLA